MSAKTVDLLPIEVLSIILGLLPLRPRLLVCGLVCKRWHAAAVRSSTCFALSDVGNGVGPQFLPVLCALYPITDLDLKLVSKPMAPITFPSRLRKLNLTLGICRSPFNFFRLPAEPPDTLEVFRLASAGRTFKFFSPWLQYLRTSLRKLSLEVDDEDVEFISSTHFPALTHLCICVVAEPGPIANEALFAFLRCHSTRLITLSLQTNAALPPPRTPLAFPALRKLSVRGPRDDFVRQIVDASPCLRRFTLCYDIRRPPDAALLCTPRVQATLVRLTTDVLSDELWGSLNLCPSLEEVHEHLNTPYVASTRASPGPAPVLLTRLRELCVESLEDFAALVAGHCMSRLRTLTVRAFSQSGPPLGLAFPHLTTLRVPTLAAAPFLLRYASDLRRCVPHLRRVALSHANLGEYELTRLVDFLRAMAAHGVEEVELRLPVRPSPELEAEIRSLRWLRVRLR